MATKIYDTFEIELENGELVTLKPLSIKGMRNFMKLINEVQADIIADETELMDVFVGASIFCLRSIYPHQFEPYSDEQMEDLMTMPAVMKVLEVCGGLKTTDPNLLGAALVGTN